MLEISVCLPEGMEKMNETIGRRDFIKLPRVTAKYQDQINTFIAHVEAAYNYIVQLNNDK